MGSSPILINIACFTAENPRILFLLLGRQCGRAGVEVSRGLLACLTKLDKHHYPYRTFPLYFVHFFLSRFIASSKELNHVLSVGLSLQVPQIQPIDVIITSVADKVSNGEIWILGGSLA
jgi:hypothetical protein